MVGASYCDLDYGYGYDLGSERSGGSLGCDGDYCCRGSVEEALFARQDRWERLEVELPRHVHLVGHAEVAVVDDVAALDRAYVDHVYQARATLHMRLIWIEKVSLNPTMSILVSRFRIGR